MRQPNWDPYETALLIEAYWDICDGKSEKSAKIAELSARLRAAAQREGKAVDEAYRNENGIRFRLGELEYLFSAGEKKKGLKNTSQMFRDMVRMYHEERDEYIGILLEAKRMYQDPGAVREAAAASLPEEVDALLRAAPYGVAKDDLLARFDGYGMNQVELALKACHAVLVQKKYHHKDNIDDYDEMADILLEILTKQFSANGGYTSARQLYHEARLRLDDFFFYNNAFGSCREVYDLALHLFRQEKYNGHEFIFLNHMHIWESEPDYPKDFRGLLIKYAREHDHVFSREEAVEYLSWIGSPSPGATFSNALLHTGKNSFLQYAENRFVLAEALHITDGFLADVALQVANLLEGGDYIAFGEIDDFFTRRFPACRRISAGRSCFWRMS